MRQRLELVALIAAGIVVFAFVLSFALGLRGDRAPRTPEPRADRNEPELAAPVDVANRRRVEVLNASKTSGLARRVTLQLRQAGYDVVYYGTASASEEDSTVVLDRVGDPSVARGVARVLGITNVVTRIDSTRMVEASVILARDWSDAAGTQARRQRWWQRLPAWLRPGS